MKHVVVIGGGASGLAAAVSAARAGARVTVVEASDRLGKPILATGNGRCNLTNARLAPDAYNAPAFVAPLLSEFGFAQVVDFFGSLGLCVREEAQGRVYPLSNTAATVVDVLVSACDALGVEQRCSFEVADAWRQGRGFVVCSREGEQVEADALVVAAGGGSELLSQFGQDLVPFEPVLCSLATDVKPLRGLSGIRVRAQVSAFHEAGDADPFAVESGEVLFRDYGLSGIVVFDLSRYVGEGDILSLNLLPARSEDQVRDLLFQRLRELGEGREDEFAFSDLLRGVFHSRVNAALLRAAGCKPSALACASKLDDLAHACVDFRVQVQGVGDAKHAQVTRGGAKLGQFDATSLEAKAVPGLYACGEALDVDGRCGGYNLHWAWASGLAAGRHAAQ